MLQFPQYIGPMAFGIKMGVILPGTDLQEEIFNSLCECSRDGLLDDGDVVCITESVVARSQNNYVSVENVAVEVKEKLKLDPRDKVAVVFPIASRNRFSRILKGIAGAVPQGEVIVQLSYPYDEVGNQIISPDCIEKDTSERIIWDSELEGVNLAHPVTGVEYLSLYREVIESMGVKATIVLCNDAAKVSEFTPDGVIVADIHTRSKTQKKITAEVGNNCITLQNICSSPSEEAWSEWGLLGSNLASGEKIKLAPREGNKFVKDVQKQVKEQLGKEIEILIYGDGAYKDPSTGIYELADPKPVFAATDGLGKFREGVKYKYLADEYFEKGKSPEEIENLLEERKNLVIKQDSIEAEGTTPRLLGDILASLADLISGSADEGTPLVLAKGYLK